MAFPKSSAVFCLTAWGAAFGQVMLPQFPDPAKVSAMSAGGGRIYAGTGAGLFASVDEGRTWSPVPELRDSIAALAALGDTVLAGTANGLYRAGSDGKWERIASGDSVPFASIAAVGGVLEASSWEGRWTSQDGGAHWSRAPVSLAFASTRALCASPQGYLFAVGREGWKHVSKDAGARWEIQPPISGGGAFWDVQAVFGADGEHAFYTTGGAIRRSPGDSEVFTPRPDQGFPVLGAMGKYLLVGYKGGMSRSADLGESFQAVGQGLGSGQTLRLASGAVSVFARTTDGVYRSQDSGRTWKRLLPGNEESMGIAARGREVYVPLGARLYHSLDDGETWSWVENPGHGFSGERNPMVITSRGLFHVGGTSLWFTANRGRDWEDLGRFSGENGVWALTAVGDRVYIALDTGILASDDFGKTWANPDSALPPMPIVARVSRGRDVYATGALGIFRSADGGKAWSPMTREGLAETQVSHSLALSGDTLYAGMEKGDSPGLYISPGPGAPWQATPNGSDIRNVTALQVIPGRILAGFSDRWMAAFSPAARNWIPIGPNMALHVAGFFQGPSRLFAFTQGQGILASGDGGLTWEAAGKGLSQNHVISLAALDDLYIGTAKDGLLRRGAGTDWASSEPLLAGRRIHSLIADGAFLYALLDSGEIARLPRGGGSARVTRLPGSGRPVHGLALADGRLYAACDSGLFAADLPGPAQDFAWNRLRAGRYRAVALRGKNLALLGSGRLLLSRDGGSTFPDSLLDTGYGALGAHPMGFTSGGDLLLGTWSGLQMVGNADRRVSQPVENGMGYALANRAETWAVASGKGIFVAKDGGPWKMVGSMPDPVHALAFSGDTLFAGGYRHLQAVYVEPATVAVPAGTGSGKPGAIRVTGFPSPGGYGLRFGLPRACRLTFTLVSLDGRSIRLFSRVPKPAGEHDALLPAGSGWRGPFRYILESEEGPETGVMKPSVQSGWIGIPGRHPISP